MNNYFIETKNENVTDMNGIEYLSKVIFRGKKEGAECAFAELRKKNQSGSLRSWDEGTLVRLVHEEKGRAVVLSEFEVKHKSTIQFETFSTVVRTLDGFQKADKFTRSEFSSAVCHEGPNYAVTKYLGDAILAETRCRLIQRHVDMPRHLHSVDGLDNNVVSEDVGEEMKALAEELGRIISSVTSDLLAAAELSCTSLNPARNLADQMILKAKAEIRKEMNSLVARLSDMM